MARQPESDLVQLLKLLRRIVVLAVAAYGLARGMPYVPLLIRVAVLWGVLYICSGVIDVVFRRLSQRSSRISVQPPPAADVTRTELTKASAG